MNFVFDIDGTICFDGKNIEQEIVHALEELQNAGHQVIFASARPIRDLMPVLPTEFKNNVMVGGNGTFIYQNGAIEVTHFEPPLLKKLLDLVQKHQVKYLADGDWDYAYTGDRDHPIYHHLNKESAKNVPLNQLNPVCKLVIFQPCNELLASLSILPVEVTHYKSELAIDISPLGVNKVHGLHKLNIRSFVAFGNDSNDKCLFEHAEHSVCVGDNDVAAFADEVVGREEVAAKIQNIGESFVRSKNDREPAKV
ncbi:HAD-IIB family hydrolase [Mangrovibacillus cuniculi]|uniref:HAD family phosphatase n=1 Tax=Mangrovibacillus cuniculi TaxID=2593652 RepID=A0A7S8CE05_9BACI|nr:HAD-IIB family hydrolase [Mangrovibacillus cuniculi]QPC48240.1 HAD family phosphatase [Mangrovibacillus cuniculi]